MNEFLENLKKQATENPIVAMGIAAGLIGAISQFVNSASWRKEVNRRVKVAKK